MSSTVSPYASADALITSVRAVLSDDLLRPKYRRRAKRHPMGGHCYAASEALYHLLGAKQAGLTPMRLRHEGDPHWYLRTAQGLYLDPTGDQFTVPPVHTQGVGCGFLTGQPSKRAAEIMRRVAEQG